MKKLSLILAAICVLAVSSNAFALNTTIKTGVDGSGMVGKLITPAMGGFDLVLGGQSNFSDDQNANYSFIIGTVMHPVMDLGLDLVVNNWDPSNNLNYYTLNLYKSFGVKLNDKIELGWDINLASYTSKAAVGVRAAHKEISILNSVTFYVSSPISIL